MRTEEGEIKFTKENPREMLRDSTTEVCRGPFLSSYTCEGKLSEVLKALLGGTREHSDQGTHGVRSSSSSHQSGGERPASHTACWEGYTEQQCFGITNNET